MNHYKRQFKESNNISPRDIIASQFISFWESDHEVTTEEWQKLNNSEE